MNMAPVDWLIVLASFGVMVAGLLMSRGYMRGVSDFLAAGRSAGRYLLSLSQGMAGLGAITIVGIFEMNYVAGFSMSWWGFTMSLVILAITVSGWVVYRFRETRCLTLPEFFERRYSRRFRIFAGLIAWLSGIINFGIFPAVEARFFIHYCGLPESFSLLGVELSTFPVTMIVLISAALLFVFTGGQIAVIVTDFIQGLFLNLAFVVVVLFLFLKVDWNQIIQALGTAPENASLINPFKTSQVDDFNLGYFLIGVAGVIYGTMSWQGTQGYNSSARTAHEAKMAGALGNWRGYPQNLMLLFVPIVAFTVLHHPDFAGVAGEVNAALAGVDEGDAVKSQLRVPLVLTHLLPVGLLGMFAAVMLAAFLTTHNSYLHSWGSIFIQDVVMPLRGRPFTPKQHLLALRLSILGVAVFIFLFSLVFRQTQYIFLFFAITGAIFAGGSGAVIIGGLYWRRGTTAAAWTAMLAGSAIAVSGILFQNIPEAALDLDRTASPWAVRALGGALRFLHDVNGQQYWALAMGGACLLYVAVSLLSRTPPCDLDRVLRRGAHAVADDRRAGDAVPARGFRMLGMGREFSRGDRFIYVATYFVTLSWVVVFLGGTVYNLTHTVPDATWARFWKLYFFIQLGFSLVVIVWFWIGGVRDLRAMFRRLDTLERDDADDGVVRRS